MMTALLHPHDDHESAQAERINDERDGHDERDDHNERDGHRRDSHDELTRPNGRSTMQRTRPSEPRRRICTNHPMANYTNHFDGQVVRFR
ncbi:hypothetical protein E6C27_scaffold385G00550 [Cucumis melo var. makuwa]|uniref:Uncharacterized protein n=1 Tax=Cucumis melo var. makuwa TaxID=1194695 RepID=A0A5A7U358_CUCMM|nr:hypothetical protein E6C27_scaffold385G00550 [Cucumis melo var. makuwa]